MNELQPSNVFQGMWLSIAEATREFAAAWPVATHVEAIRTIVIAGFAAAKEFNADTEAP